MVNKYLSFFSNKERYQISRVSTTIFALFRKIFFWRPVSEPRHNSEAPGIEGGRFLAPLFDARHPEHAQSHDGHPVRKPTSSEGASFQIAARWYICIPKIPNLVRSSLNVAAAVHGCQMVYLHTKNTNFGKCLKTLEWKLFGSFHDLLVVLCPFGIF
jgi:hypothetical protein